jgi:hypothetical protein
MKKAHLLFGLFFTTASAFAQGPVSDTVVMGPGYTNQHFYTLGTGKSTTAAVNNWDIAHTTDGRSSCIRANHMTGLRVFSYPKNGTAGWATFDTTGWKSWRQRWNNIREHEKGAFSLTSSHPVYDWGSYNSSTHEITGDSLFLLGWTSDEGKTWNKLVKFWPVKQTASTDLVFKYANLDGSGEYTDTLYQSTAAGQNYKYFSFNQIHPVREPKKGTWDLSFNRYYEYVNAGPGSGWYAVMGVESNKATVTVSRIMGPTWATVLADTQNLISKYGAKANKDMTAVGSNWKFFNNQTFQWIISDTSNYLIKSLVDSDTAWYLVHFTGIGGTSNGRIIFASQRLSFKRNSVMNPVLGVMNIFPNPASSNVIVALEANKKGIYTITLRNLTGQALQTIELNTQNQENTVQFSLTDMPAGLYTITAESAGSSMSSRLIVE